MGSNKDGTIAAEVNGRLDDLFGDNDDDRQAAPFGNKRTEAEKRSGGLAGGEDEQDVVELKGGPASHFESGAWEQEEEEMKTVKAENSLINDLKSVILSLEWEISDEVMQKLGEEIEKLKVICKEDKIIVAFLQLLDSLGKYIQKKKAESHPDSISLLNSVYENLEKVTASPAMNEATKKKLLVSEVNKYKKLKDIITGKSDSPLKTEEKPAPASHAPEHSYEEEEEVGISAPMPSRFPGSVQEEPVVAYNEPLRKDTDSQQDAVVQMLREIHRTIQSEFKALREELKRWRERQ
ncbi:MAG: hypothetical protein BWK80_30030 [Desulfobacteraceae bacterium IS3]|nr:MAG: hypothetical protein BWK80_30030 [Desulfobacteraceae bacterium IS3]